VDGWGRLTSDESTDSGSWDSFSAGGVSVSGFSWGFSSGSGSEEISVGGDLARIGGLLQLGGGDDSHNGLEEGTEEKKQLGFGQWLIDIINKGKGFYGSRSTELVAVSSCEMLTYADVTNDLTFAEFQFGFYRITSIVGVKIGRAHSMLAQGGSGPWIWPGLA
jgi:hypothetical protein